MLARCSTRCGSDRARNIPPGPAAVLWSWRARVSSHQNLLVQQPVGVLVRAALSGLVRWLKQAGCRWRW
jgi:hypothetical protein